MFCLQKLELHKEPISFLGIDKKNKITETLYNVCTRVYIFCGAWLVKDRQSVRNE